MIFLRFALGLMMVTMLHASDFIIKKSDLSVDATIAKIQKIVEAKKGLGVFTIIDHKKGADRVGLALPKTKVILFGNPKMGTKLMQKDPRVALDLPMRVLVYREGNETKIVYHNPKAWSKAFHLKDCKLIEKMTNALDKITDKAGKK